MASNLTFTAAPFLSATTITSATSVSTNVTVLAANATTDRRIYSLAVTSSDNAANNMLFSLNDGVTSYPVCKLAISLSAGTNTSTAIFDVLGSSLMVGAVKERDANGQSFMHIPKGWSLQAQYQSAMTGVEFLNVFVGGHTY